MIPCYRVAAHVLDVIARVGPEVWRIYVVDDACPEHTGDLVERTAPDVRVRVLRNSVNRGVGGAVMAGYEAALRDGADVMVKIDGDGQMDPSLLSRFVEPILRGQADYAKGNRFFDLFSLRGMPPMRLFGNAVLSLLAKISTGYWTLFDPTNGYTAIDARVASWLRFDSVSERYFFETDMLFRLNTLRAVVIDVPMDAIYANEKSNLRITRILGEFLFRHARNAFKRVFYNYFLRDMSVASLELVVGLIMVAFGFSWGAEHWWRSAQTGVVATMGTIMVAVLPLLLGTQLLLSFLAYDMASVPSQPCSSRLGRRALSDRPSQRVGPPEEPRRPSASAR